jgi:hypothetical protein
MPFPDSEYPSILRGRGKRESQRLLAAAPGMLAVLRHVHFALEELSEDSDEAGWRNMDATRVDELLSSMFLAVDACIDEAEWRNE